MTIIIFSIIEALVAAAVVFFLHSQSGSGNRKNLVKLQEEQEKKSQFKVKLIELYKQMITVDRAKVVVSEANAIQDSLKAERGRITITQAELETVDGRLRELDEIERELIASGLETKEELNILQKKEGELRNKNNTLKQQLTASMEQINSLMAEIEMTANMQEQVEIVTTDLLSTEEKIDTLLLQIEQGNEQYFILKTRYDALDIEYAQLYERFAEAEDAVAEEED